MAVHARRADGSSNATGRKPHCDHDLDFDGPLERVHLTAYTYSVGHFVLEDARSAFDLNPPYQRASVWDLDRRRALIRSLPSLGIPVGGITLNDRGPRATGLYAVVDGKQRIETLRAFVDDEFAIPATWIEAEYVLETVDVDGWDVPGVVFSGLDRGFRTDFRQRPIGVAEAKVTTIEAEAEIFRLINTGGVAQTEATLGNAAAVENRKTNR